MRWPVAALAVAMLLPGCSTEEAPTAPPQPPPVPAPEGPNATAESAPTIPRTLYLGGALTLNAGAPTRTEAERVPSGRSLREAVTESDVPLWSGTAAPVAFVVTAARLTFFYAAEGGTTNLFGGGVPPFAGYLGTPESTIASGYFSGPDTLQDGQVVEASGELELPVGGLVVAAGQPLTLSFTHGYVEEEGGPQIVLLVNSTSTLSRAELALEATVLPDSIEALAYDERGALPAPTFGNPPQDTLSAATYSLEIGADTTGIRVLLEHTATAGFPDVDVEVLGPGGNQVATSRGVLPTERVALYAPNVEAVGQGTWTLRVFNFGGVNAQYRVQIWTLQTAMGPGVGP